MNRDEQDASSSFLAGTAIDRFARPALAQARRSVFRGDVKIGVLNDNPASMPMSRAKAPAVAARMAAEEFGGKVAGKPIEIISADHQNKADIFATSRASGSTPTGVDAIADRAVTPRQRWRFRKSRGTRPRLR